MKREKLEAAEQQGLINKTQIDPLLAFLNNDVVVNESGSEEQLRFVRSFGDIFITLGIIFVVVAGAQVEMTSYTNIIPLLISIATAEWLVRIRRLALPGIALLVAIIYFASQVVGFSFAEPALQNVITLTILAGLFFLRYKMPFTLLPIAIGILAIISIFFEIEFSEIKELAAVYGLAVFSIAMWFDSRDTKRLNRLSDSAFWLHLLAAPLIVHGLMISMLTTSDLNLSKEILIVIFFIIFFLIALYVDRRAMLVSSTSYAIYAVVSLANENTHNFENMTLMIFIVFGAFIIFFGANWYKARYFIFSKLGGFGLSRYVPPFERKL